MFDILAALAAARARAAAANSNIFPENARHAAQLSGGSGGPGPGVRGSYSAAVSSHICILSFIDYWRKLNPSGGLKLGACGYILHFVFEGQIRLALSSTMMIMTILMVMMGKNMVLQTQNPTSIFSRSAATGWLSPPR